MLSVVSLGSKLVGLYNLQLFLILKLWTVNCNYKHKLIIPQPIKVKSRKYEVQSLNTSDSRLRTYDFNITLLFRQQELRYRHQPQRLLLQQFCVLFYHLQLCQLLQEHQLLI